MDQIEEVSNNYKQMENKERTSQGEIIMKFGQSIYILLIVCVLSAFCVFPVAASWQENELMDKIKKKTEIKRGISGISLEFSLCDGTIIWEHRETLRQKGGKIITEINFDQKKQMKLYGRALSTRPLNTFKIFTDDRPIAIAEGTCDVVGKIEDIYSIENIAFSIYNECGESDNLNIHSVRYEALHDANEDVWKLVRHTHLTANEAQGIKYAGSFAISLLIWCTLGILSVEMGSIPAFVLSEALGQIWCTLYDRQLNPDGSLDTYEVIYTSRLYRYNDNVPTVDDLCSEVIGNNERRYKNKLILSKFIKDLEHSKSINNEWHKYQLYSGKKCLYKGHSAIKTKHIHIPLYIKI